MDGLQLFCTFAHRSNLNLVIGYIKNRYSLENNIYVFCDVNNKDQCYVSYNIKGTKDYDDLLESTILIHRKKETNTLYTLNALNTIIRSANNGKLNKNFEISWENYTNSLLLVKDEVLNKINLELLNVIKNK